MTDGGAGPIQVRVPEELDAGLARRIGRAFVDVTGAREVVLGRDIRLSSPSLATAVALYGIGRWLIMRRGQDGISMTGGKGNA